MSPGWHDLFPDAMRDGGSQHHGGIDAVYTWVDGSDPEFREALRRHCGEATPASFDSVAPRRFRSHDELKYSLRSLDLHAPWIRHVHIVTNGQIPSWLDTSNPRSSLVTHREIFPNPADLPSFNSNAIEMHLHRIPGLSPRFLYLNDDLFLGRPAEPTDFFPTGVTERVYLDSWTLPESTEAAPPRDRAAIRTMNLVVEGGSPAPRNAIAHVPHAYRVSFLRRLAKRWKREVEATSAHRFRSQNDLVLNVLYYYSLMQLEPRRWSVRRLENWTPDYCLVRFGQRTDVIGDIFQRMLAARPRFFCINDDGQGDDPEIPAAVLTDFLEAYYPKPSRFEIG